LALGDGQAWRSARRDGAILTVVGTASAPRFRVRRVVEGWAGEAPIVMMAWPLAMSTEHQLLTGDDDFDATCFVVGPDELLAAMDVAMRRKLRTFVELGGRVVDLEVRLEEEELARLETSSIDWVLDLLADIAQGLGRDTGSFGMKVAMSLVNDPHPGVRERLSSLFGERPEVKALIRAPESDESGVEQLLAEALDERIPEEGRRDAVARVFAARFRASKAADARRGELPYEDVVSLARKLPPSLSWVAIEEVMATLDVAGRDPSRAPQEGGADRVALWWILHDRLVASESRTHRADLVKRFSRVLKGLRGPSVVASLERLCASDDIEVCVTALMSLAGQGDVEAMFVKLGRGAFERVVVALPQVAHREPQAAGPLIAKLLPMVDPRRFEVRQRLVQGLGDTGDPQWVPLLLEQLESPFDEVQCAAIEALGNVGEMSVVTTIEPFTSGLFRSGAVKARARAAIARVRERHHARSLPGAMSLADEPAGGLSVVAGENRGAASQGAPRG
jgi:hypothetical protein